MTTDSSIVRIVVVTIAAVVIGSLIAMSYLTATHTTIPDALKHTFDVGFGSLATLLATTRSGPVAPAPVQVVNEPDAPVPVDAAPGPPPPLVLP